MVEGGISRRELHSSSKHGNSRARRLRKTIEHIGLSAVLTLTGASETSQTTSYMQPPNYCTMLTPFSSGTKALAELCVQQNKRETIVDFAGLSKATRQEVRDYTEKAIEASSGLETRVTIVSPSEKTKALYQRLLQPGARCLDENLTPPAAIAWQQQLHEQHTVVVALVKPKSCNGELVGIAYDSTLFSTVFIGATGHDPEYITDAVVHEGVGGHQSILGHTSFFQGYNHNPYSTSNYDTFNISGPVINLERNYFNEGPTQGELFIYDRRSIMGMGNLKINQIPLDTPIQLDDLNWAKALLGEAPLRARMMNKDIPVSINNQQAHKGDYVMASLNEPIVLGKHKKDPGIAFDMIAFIPQMNPHTKTIDAVKIWLYDSVSTHNNAYLGVDNLNNSSSLGGQEFTITDTTFLLHKTKKGLTMQRRDLP